MPQPDDLAAALARLGALAPRPGVNIRPVLLRVVVDLFLQRDVHTPFDLKAFEAMVGPLLDQADPATKRTVAEQLTRHPETPHALLDRLVDERMLAAAAMFRRAPLDDAELLDVATRGPVTVAMMIAQRRTLPQAAVAALAARPEHQIAMALVGNRGVLLEGAVLVSLVERARNDPALAHRLAGRGLDPITMAPLFPVLGAEPRRSIIDAARRHDLGRREWGRPDGATAAILAQLDRLVLCGEWDGFDHSLCVALGCDEAALRPLLHDGTGDILAIALSAVGAPADMAARAFILGDPAIGRSVTAVRRLILLVQALTPPAARRLLGSMLAGADQPQRRTLPPAKPVPPGRGRPEQPATQPVPARRSTGDGAIRQRG